MGDDEIKDIKPALLGLLTGATITEIWNRIPKKPKIYLDGIRLHHYPAGLLMMIVGAIISKLTKNQQIKDTGVYLTYLGMPIFVDDLDDFIKAVKELMK
jgi:hypothetical protein